MWNAPLPPVREVNALAYSSISAIGTSALMTCEAPRASVPWTRPAATRHVAHHVAQAVVRDRDLGVHDGLEEGGFSLLKSPP